MRKPPMDLTTFEKKAGEVAQALKAIGNDRRLMVLCKLVEHGERTVGDLADDVGLSQSALSQHLARMRDEGLVAFRREREDGLNLVVTSVFPSSVFVQISNSLAVRQIRPRGVNEVEVFQTMLGYQDDTPEMTRHRLHQANLVGPAGLVSRAGSSTTR